MREYCCPSKRGEFCTATLTDLGFSVVSVRAYSLEEILAEKIRSLFQRTRPRDLYDVWALKDRADVRTVAKILPFKFEAKSVEPDLDALSSRRGYYYSAWKSSLGHQLGRLPDFESVWSEVLDFVRWILESAF
jgi:predicted nucleotidyltransferase component of viral defense system